jgi:hypothetical protein
VRVHYYRHDGEAASFGLHVWQDVLEETRLERTTRGRRHAG